jgi:preprotein translocase subunit Sec61beta
MSKKDRNMMPQSTAGLIRYFEESEEAIKLKPEHVVGIAVLIIIIELALKFMIFI